MAAWQHQLFHCACLQHRMMSGLGQEFEGSFYCSWCVREKVISGEVTAGEPWQCHTKPVKVFCLIVCWSDCVSFDPCMVTTSHAHGGLRPADSLDLFFFFLHVAIKCSQVLYWFLKSEQNHSVSLGYIIVYCFIYLCNCFCHFWMNFVFYLFISSFYSFSFSHSLLLSASKLLRVDSCFVCFLLPPFKCA